MLLEIWGWREQLLKSYLNISIVNLKAKAVVADFAQSCFKAPMSELKLTSINSSYC